MEAVNAFLGFAFDQFFDHAGDENFLFVFEMNIFDFWHCFGLEVGKEFVVFVVEAGSCGAEIRHIAELIE